MEPAATPEDLPQTRCILLCFRMSKRNKHVGFKADPHILRGNKQLGGWRGKTPHMISGLEDRRAAALAEILKWFVALKINITKKWMKNWNKQSESTGIRNSKGQMYQPSDQERMTDSLLYQVWAAIRKTNKGTFYQSFSRYAIFVWCTSHCWRSYNL